MACANVFRLLCKRLERPFPVIRFHCLLPVSFLYLLPVVLCFSFVPYLSFLVVRLFGFMLPLVASVRGFRSLVESVVFLSHNPCSLLFCSPTVLAVFDLSFFFAPSCCVVCCVLLDAGSHVPRGGDVQQAAVRGLPGRCHQTGPSVFCVCVRSVCVCVCVLSLVYLFVLVCVRRELRFDVFVILCCSRNLAAGRSFCSSVDDCCRFVA